MRDGRLKVDSLPMGKRASSEIDLGSANRSKKEFPNILIRIRMRIRGKLAVGVSLYNIMP